MGSGGTECTCSPATPSNCLLVASTLSCGAARKIASITVAQLSIVGIGGEVGGHPARCGTVRWHDEHDQVGVERHDVDVGAEWLVGEVGGGDDVGVASLQWWLCQPWVAPPGRR